jgi:hypothetical protein
MLEDDNEGKIKSSSNFCPRHHRLRTGGNCYRTLLRFYREYDDDEDNDD